ncbi:MAG: glycosyltransferase [Syntrophales bacterium]
MDENNFSPLPSMISLVIPVFNEEKNLHALLKRIVPAMKGMDRPYEIIFVDDGSKDDSLRILKTFVTHPEVKIIELTKNYGQHAAILAGFSIAKGSIIVTMDADLQNPPEEISRMVKVMEEGDYDIVGTIRKKRHDSIFRKLPSKIINAVARRIIKVNMSDWGCMLRAYRNKVVSHMIDCHEHGTFIPALATIFAKRMTEIEVSHEERYGGESHYRLGKLINLQFDLVASFSDLPMRLLMYGGIIMSFTGILFGTVLIVARFMYGAHWAVYGVFTLFAILFVFMGLQFFALGVIGEYIGRIYNEVRKRPEYIIERIYSADDSGGES